MTPNGYTVVAFHMLDGNKPGGFQVFSATNYQEAAELAFRWDELELSLVETSGGYPGEAVILKTVDMEDGLPPVVLVDRGEGDERLRSAESARDWLAQSK